MSLTIADDVLGLQNTTVRATMSVQADVSGTKVPADPYNITLSIMDIAGTVRFTDSWSSGGPAPARIVRSGVGKFYIDFGNQTPNNETSTAGDLIFNWQIQMENGSSTINTLQPVKIISAKVASLLPPFKLLIDKSRKFVNLSEDCFLGYTDAQLIQYLEGGVQTINAYQPYGYFDLDSFPLDFKQMLFDAGLVIGVTSQQLFAVDTDIPNYSDNGTSFVITHQPQLAAFLNQITQRLDKMIPQMKLHMVNSGHVHVQMGANYKLAQLMASAPTGAIFRGVFFRG